MGKHPLTKYMNHSAIDKTPLKSNLCVGRPEQTGPGLPEMPPLITMAVYMSETYRLGKLGGDKVALLGLFVLALLVARLVVGLKSAISLSGAISLPCEKLSVSMPSGNGWYSQERWEFLDNTFVLRSVFALHSSKPTAQVNCRYLLAAEPAPPRTRFEQMAREVDGAVVKAGQTEAATLTIDWAQIKKPDILLDVFFGTAKLPNNRQLDIEVRQISGGAELAQRTFQGIVASLSFKESSGNAAGLKAGAELVTALKSQGLDPLANNPDRQTFYLVKDSAEQPIGFAADGLIDPGQDAQSDIRTASFLYIKGRNTLEQRTVFQCSRSLEEFVCKSQTSTGAGVSSTEIIADKTGLMTVRKFGTQTQQKSYRLGRAAIPDVFLDQVLWKMLDANEEKIIVDIIDASGEITPTSVSRIEAGKDAVSAFELKFLDGRGFSEQVFLNEQRQIHRMLLHQENTYSLERTSAESVASEFPEYTQRFLRSLEKLKSDL